MKHLFGIAIGLAAAFMFFAGIVPGPLMAQDKGLAAQDVQFTEVKLTKGLIESFLKAQKGLNALGDQSPANEAEERALQAKVEAIAVAAGFADYIAMDDAAQTITLVFSGFDPSTGSFIEPLEAIKQEIKAAQADDALPEEPKAALLADLKAELAATKPLKYRGNVAIVKSNLSRIASVMK